jgi:hypothetical protein
MFPLSRGGVRLAVNGRLIFWEKRVKPRCPSYIHVIKDIWGDSAARGLFDAHVVMGYTHESPVQRAKPNPNQEAMFV